MADMDNNPIPPQNQMPMLDKKVHNPFTNLLPGEQVIFIVKRHPIGIIAVYLGAAILLIAVAAFVFGVAPDTFQSVDHSRATTIGAAGFGLVAILTLAFVWAYNLIYWNNAWIVTNTRITDVTQLSLFSKESSQMSLANLEDVTADKSGFLQTIFNYGVLRAETAGEVRNFEFKFCPNPDKYAAIMLDVREKFERNRHPQRGDAQRLNRDPNTYTGDSATESFEVPS